jgi:hypothetical protein
MGTTNANDFAAALSSGVALDAASNVNASATATNTEAAGGSIGSGSPDVAIAISGEWRFSEERAAETAVLYYSVWRFSDR